MAHPKKEREFLVDKAIEFGIFKTLTFDVENSNQKEYIELANELKEQGVDPEKAYRVVSVLPDGAERVTYTSREGLVELLNDDEGFDFVWQALKNECEKEIDEEQGCSIAGDVEHEDYEELQ